MVVRFRLYSNFLLPGGRARPAPDDDVIRRIGKALRQCQDVKLVARTAEKVKGEYVWRAI